MAYNLLDLKQGVWHRCRGQGFAETDIGKAAILDCINKAYIETISMVASLSLAGTLAGLDHWHVSSGKEYTRFPYNSSAAESGEVAAGQALAPIAPCAIELEQVIDTASEWMECRFVEPEKMLFLSRETLMERPVYHYSFLRDEIWVRPYVGEGTLYFHYISTPTTLVNDGDLIKCSDRLFPAIVLRAASKALGKLPSTDPQLLNQLYAEFRGELAVFGIQTRDAIIREYESRSQRDLTLGGAAPGKG